MSTARHRNSDNRLPVSGTFYWSIRSPPVKSSSRLQGAVITTDDVVGNRTGVNPFSSVRDFTVVPVLNGKYLDPVNGNLLREFRNYPVDGAISPISTLTQFPLPTLVELNQLAWEALAKSSPVTPLVSVPTFLAELKDAPGLVDELFSTSRDLVNLLKHFRLLPSALRYWGYRLLRRLASGHLTYRWAIKPLISDLFKLLSFAKHVTKRVKLLKALRKDKFIRTKVSMGSESRHVGQTSSIIHSDGDVWTLWKTSNFTSKMWFSAQWNTTMYTDIPELDPAIYKLAENLVYGKTGHEALAALWEITPWSWLVDWFVGVGDVIAATNNTLRLTSTRCCLMRTTTSETSYKLRQAGTWSTLSGMPYAQQTRKERFLASPTLPLAPTFLPLITSSKWSILASLTVLKSERLRRSGL